MANPDLLIPHILKWEGGYVNDPDDRGGATNKGVTLATLREYRQSIGEPYTTIADLRNLDDATWRAIFIRRYWNRWRADEIQDQRVANMLVDWVWHSGTPGITNPQQILGVKVDGIVGPKTIAAVNAADPSALFERLYQARESYLRNLATKGNNAKFLRGWLNRIKDLVTSDKGLVTNYECQ